MSDPQRASDELTAALNRLGRLMASRQIPARVAEVAGVETSQQGVQILRSLALRGEQPIAATVAGRRVAERVDDVLTRHLDDALAGWSAAERRQLGSLLGRLVHDLRATEFRPGDHDRSTR